MTENGLAWRVRLVLLLAILAPLLTTLPRSALAVKVLAVVNDMPVTDFDVRQRMSGQRHARYRFRRAPTHEAAQTVGHALSIHRDGPEKGAELAHR